MRNASPPAKVKLRLRPFHPWGDRPGQNPESRSVRVRELVPFFQTAQGRYVHRVRSADWFLNDPKRRRGLAMHGWCGVMTPHTDRLHGAPPIGEPLCATCEARAVGAGYPPTSSWEKPPLMFKPQSDLEPRP